MSPSASCGFLSPNPTRRGIQSRLPVFASLRMLPRYPPITTTFPVNLLRGSLCGSFSPFGGEGVGEGSSESELAMLRKRLGVVKPRFLGKEGKEGVRNAGRVGRVSNSAWRAVFCASSQQRRVLHESSDPLRGGA